MPPRNFADDGAAGAGGGGNFGQSAGDPTGGFTADDSGMAGGASPSSNGTPSTGAPTTSGSRDSANWTSEPRGIDAGNPFHNAAQNPGGDNWDQSGINAFGQAVPRTKGGSVASQPASYDPSGIDAFGQRVPTTSLDTRMSQSQINTAMGANDGNTVRGLGFADGGAIPDADGDNDGDTGTDGDTDGDTGATMQRSITDAMRSVQDALSYGRNLHGLGGGQQEAAAMPTRPGTQSESGVPPQRPAPQQPQFGKRADAAMDDGSSDQTAVMPSAPFSETPKPQPMPGPLPPTSNPFGKRGQQADAGDGQAIDTEEAA